MLKVGTYQAQQLGKQVPYGTVQKPKEVIRSSSLASFSSFGAPTYSHPSFSPRVSQGPWLFPLPCLYSLPQSTHRRICREQRTGQEPRALPPCQVRQPMFYRMLKQGVRKAGSGLKKQEGGTRNEVKVRCGRCQGDIKEQSQNRRHPKGMGSVWPGARGQGYGQVGRLVYR